LGLKEISTYLLIGQALFQFLNDMTLMQSEVDRAARSKIEDAKKRLARKRQEEATGKSVKEEDVDLQRSKSENQRPITLDEILVNEGLIKFEVSKTKRLWTRGLSKIQTLIKDRHFADSKIKVSLRGFRFSLVDNSVNP
jgi:hypothetical protein